MGSAEALGGLREDSFHNAVEIIENLAIPEADYPPALRFQKCGVVLIVNYGIEMLRSIELNRELRAPARKVQNIGTNDKLPGKTRAISRDTLPHHSLRVGLAVTQDPSIGGHVVGDTAHDGSVARLALLAYPPPAPSLSGRETKSPAADVAHHALVVELEVQPVLT